MDKNELRETFNHFDNDSNGAIDFSEFDRLMLALDPEMEDEAKKIGFELIDEDRSGTLEFEEFAAWFSDD